MSTPDLFHGPNAGYMLELYERYCDDPDSVDAATRAYFEQLTTPTPSPSPTPTVARRPAAPVSPPSAHPPAPTPPRTAATAPPPATHQPPSPPVSAAPTASTLMHAPPIEEEPHYVPTIATNGEQEASTFSLPPADDTTAYRLAPVVAAVRLVRLIRELGHLDAHIDPLGSKPPGDPGLELETHHLTEDDLAALPSSIVISPVVQDSSNALEAIRRLREVYSGSIGYEDNHVQSHEERAWLREAAESRRFFQMDAAYQRDLLERLTEVECFERFIHQTFPGQKRFSLEGNDTLIPMMDVIIHHAAESGTREVVIGMAHRGRLNVLAHVLGKTYSAILAEFQGPNYYNKATYQGWTGDVKYHLGARKAYRESAVYEMPISLVPNPSHLEFVNPVVQGRARAAQRIHDRSGVPSYDFRAALPLLIHGDASFPGQGVVAETLNLSRLRGYRTGGTIHIIINNQIGFTTDAHDSRSTLYAGDLAKGFEIPIVHVNADDPVACVAAARMAWAYRDRFAKDFLIDLVGYRRWGHNEGDDPAFTQPLMYHIISNHPTVRDLWARSLEQRGVITPDESHALLTKWQTRLQRAQHEVERGGRIEATVAVSAATLLHRPVTEAPPVARERLLEWNGALLRRPETFRANEKLERLLQRRQETITAEGGIDWGLAEALAFASILADGTPIRMTGQDVERGTFSHRHLVLHDIRTGEPFIPLQHIPHAQASFAIYNSPLSENATLGFEYGYSAQSPDVLVLWEAQFGDFCNGAQVFIDQFIVSGNAKWGQQPGLVLLLPHGYEGQGPEHSSARLERFLQLAADNNIRIVNCTTAAQYFHLLRRQSTLLRSDPRPLIVMSPKSLLRHPSASSSLSDLTDGHFQALLPPQPVTDPEQITHLVLCSGKVYVDLMTSHFLAHDGNGYPQALPKHMVAARIEELYPFPTTELESLIASYPNLQGIVWLQEEPENMGAWRYVEPRIRALLSKDNGQIPTSITLSYCGRPESASPAEGMLSQHKIEQERILRELVQIKTSDSTSAHHSSVQER